MIAGTVIIDIDRSAWPVLRPSRVVEWSDRGLGDRTKLKLIIYLCSINHLYKESLAVVHSWTVDQHIQKQCPVVFTTRSTDDWLRAKVTKQ